MMADSLLVAIAKSVATEIAAHDWGQTLATVEWSFADWDEKLPELVGYRVDVVPVSYDKVEVTSRAGGKRIDLTLEIGIRKRITDLTVAGHRDKDSTALAVALFESMMLWYTGRAVVGVSEAVAWQPSPLATYDREQLRGSGLYVGVFQIKAVGLKVS
jgi:ABC-type amino acid transport substrate-binding protein